ncbi:topoisomerase II-associated protein PAT1 [Auriculariales sp. MPI-PUGE-AT-0066]|nr:topoisomerase II-associated protein PAT1 [Auriculariales sp. MPI-PUGE-AT-0066]
MAFFGLSTSLEDERNKACSRDAACRILNGGGGGGDDDDVPVYNWGEASYDGLGDALLDGNDDLNDETFGGSGPVGKDFDFTHQQFDTNDVPVSYHRHTPEPSHFVAAPSPSPSHTQARPPRDSRWDDRNALSAMIGRLPSASGVPTNARPQPPPRTGSAFSTGVAIPRDAGTPANAEDVEAELLALARQARTQQAQQYAQHQQQHSRQLTMEEIEEQLHAQALLQQQQQQQHSKQHSSTAATTTAPAPATTAQQREQVISEQLLLQQQLLQQQQASSAAALAQAQQQHRGQQHSRTFSEQTQQHMLVQAQMQEQLQMLRQRHVHAQQQTAAAAQAVQATAFQVQAASDPAILALDADARAALMHEAARKILQTEQLEDRRRRRVIKMQRMSKYNELMTQGDKDFITRIQVSQLVSADPFLDDYYAQVFRQRLGVNTEGDNVLKLGGGGVGLGMPNNRAGRRENALQRMQQQVERLVKLRQQAEKEKGTHALEHLQGALGKTSGRSYKAAPRQLLQVDPSHGTNGTTSPKKAAGQLTGEQSAVLSAFHDQTKEVGPQKPLDRYQVLMQLEEILASILDAELLHRRRAKQEIPEEKFAEDLALQQTKIFTTMHVTDPLETSDPHPFISLLRPQKGKRMLPRAIRVLPDEMTTHLITLLLACFYQLDVVQNARVMDDIGDAGSAAAYEAELQVFNATVLQQLQIIISTASLGLVAGFLSVLVMHQVQLVAMSKPGLQLLTFFLARAGALLTDEDPEHVPTEEEKQQWKRGFNSLFHLLEHQLGALFPSTRIYAKYPNNPELLHSAADRHVWDFLALLANQGDATPHHVGIVRATEARDQADLELKAKSLELLLDAVHIKIEEIQF